MLHDRVRSTKAAVVAVSEPVATAGVPRGHKSRSRTGKTAPVGRRGNPSADRDQGLHGQVVRGELAVPGERVEGGRGYRDRTAGEDPVDARAAEDKRPIAVKGRVLRGALVGRRGPGVEK